MVNATVTFKSLTWKSQAFGRDRFVAGQLPVLQAAADRIAVACGEGYEAKPAAQGRWGGGRVAVVTRTARAKRAEAKHHNLARYAGGGR